MTQKKTIFIAGNELANKAISQLETPIKKAAALKPGLAIIQVGDDPASTLYVEKKIAACKAIGINTFSFKFSVNSGEHEIINKIIVLNSQDDVHGIMVQLPLPKPLSSFSVCNSIAPSKDVDGLTATNIGKLALGQPQFIPATVKAIIHIIEHIKLCLRGLNVVIIGNSNIIGKPLALLMANALATVTICHKESYDIATKVKAADIVVSAIGKRNIIQAEWIQEKAVVIDVGIIREKDTVYGDIDSSKVICKAITPVPGGVGPLTIAMLMQNTMIAYNNTIRPYAK